MTENQIKIANDAFKYLRNQCAYKSTEERTALVEEHFALKRDWHICPKSLVGVYEVQEAKFIGALNQVADYIETTETA